MLDCHLTATASKDHLLAARMATLMHEATSSEAIALREEVLIQLNRSKQELRKGHRQRVAHEKELLTQRSTLDAILADLIAASSHLEALGYTYRRSKRQDFTDSGTKASSRSYEWQMDALERLELVDRKIGLSAKDDFDGTEYVAYRRATRFRATPKLLSIARRHDITSENINQHYFKNSFKLLSPIVLKARNTTTSTGKALRCPDTRQVRQLRGQVEQVNTIYARHRFDGTQSPQVYRVFNCGDMDGYSFNKGGRLYAEFQRMPQECRQRLRIDGKATVELDLKASQLTILYGITATDMDEGDPYCITGLPRAVTKTVITTMIGLGHTNLSRWPTGTAVRLQHELTILDGGAKNRFNKAYPIKATAERVLMHHPVLHHLSPGQMDWADLQFIESEILITCILRLGEEHDVPALPLHDSIIIGEDHTDLAYRILSETFKQKVGRSAVIEKK